MPLSRSLVEFVVLRHWGGGSTPAGSTITTAIWNDTSFNGVAFGWAAPSGGWVERMAVVLSTPVTAADCSPRIQEDEADWVVAPFTLGVGEQRKSVRFHPWQHTIIEGRRYRTRFNIAAGFTPTTADYIIEITFAVPMR